MRKFYKRGVLTIEAAMTVPLFLMAMVVLISLANVYWIKACMDTAVYDEAHNYAIVSDYGGYRGTGAITARIDEQLNNLNDIDYSDTDITDDEIAVISAGYDYRVPFFIFNTGVISCESKAIVHKWNGYDNGLSGAEGIGEYVYITDNAAVYHRSRECRHIRLHIKAVTGREINKLRNDSGAKYKKCEYCRPKKSAEKLYITTDGDKYHSSLACRGLKRTIYRVRLRELGDMRPCTACGY